MFNRKFKYWKLEFVFNFLTWRPQQPTTLRINVYYDQLDGGHQPLWLSKSNQMCSSNKWISNNCYINKIIVIFVLQEYNMVTIIFTEECYVFGIGQYNKVVFCSFKFHKFSVCGHNFSTIQLLLHKQENKNNIDYTNKTWLDTQIIKYRQVNDFICTKASLPTEKMEV